jgi:bacteriocin biosynthesis cyclodehydratase domain-containing protein
VAYSIRLTGATSRQVMIGGVGEFGRRVAGLLSAGLPKAQEFEVGDGISTAFSSGANTVVLALWRPEPELCEMADELSFRNLVAWLPVIMEHPVIRIGPFVDPTAGPCFRCYSRRRAQHDRQPWVTATLHATYRRDDGWGPVGYLPHQARMASAVALGTLSERALESRSEDQSRIEGEVTTIGLATSSLQANSVVTCHNCDRCSGTESGAVKPSARLDWLSELAAFLHTQTNSVSAEFNGYGKRTDVPADQLGVTS